MISRPSRLQKKSPSSVLLNVICRGVGLSSAAGTATTQTCDGCEGSRYPSPLKRYTARVTVRTSDSCSPCSAGGGSAPSCPGGFVEALSGVGFPCSPGDSGRGAAAAAGATAAG